MTRQTVKNISKAIVNAKTDGKIKVSATYEVELLIDAVSTFATIYKFGKKVADLFISCDSYGYYSVIDGDSAFEKYLNID